MNIIKANESLYMIQPAITRVIKEIENYYGVYLFEWLGCIFNKNPKFKNLLIFLFNLFNKVSYHISLF